MAPPTAAPTSPLELEDAAEVASLSACGPTLWLLGLDVTVGDTVREAVVLGVPVPVGVVLGVAAPVRVEGGVEEKDCVTVDEAVGVKEG